MWSTFFAQNTNTKFSVKTAWWDNSPFSRCCMFSPFSTYPHFYSVKTNLSPVYYRVLTLAQMTCFPNSFPLVMLLYWTCINILLSHVLVSRLMVPFSGWKTHCKFSLLDMWFHFPTPSEFWNKKISCSLVEKNPKPKPYIIYLFFCLCIKTYYVS